MIELRFVEAMIEEAKIAHAAAVSRAGNGFDISCNYWQGRLDGLQAALKCFDPSVNNHG